MPCRIRFIQSICLALAMAATLWPSGSRAGAWVQAEDRGYFRIGYFGMDSRSRYDGNGDRIGLYTRSGGSRPVEYGDREIRGYGEYGISDRVTAIGSITWKQLQNRQPTTVFETTGSGDAHVGARIGLHRSTVPLSAEIELKIPTAYDETVAPALGSGSTDAVVRFLAGTSWGKGYAVSDVGYNLRGGGYRDEFRYTGEVGNRLVGPIYGRAVARGITALGSGGSPAESVRDVFDPGLASPRSLSLTGTLGCDVGGGLAVEASFEHVAMGREALAGNGLELAFAWSGLVRRHP